MIWTYAAIARFSTDRAAEQAALEQFQVGATYPCWYDQDQPDRAALVRSEAWAPYGAVIVPIVFIGFGGAGLRGLWKNRD